jgi:hypothetical protein
MIKAAIETILSLGGNSTQEINGRQYTNGPGGIKPLTLPKVRPLVINTLTGIVDYAPTPDTMVHVVGPTSVNLIEKSFGPEGWLTRQTFIEAVHESPAFAFGRWMDQETFIINLQAMFVQDENTAAILKVVGNIKDEAVAQHTDDGITQSVVAKAGISRVEQVAVPNPVTLRPYRTFMEIEQPASTFILRMKGGKGELPYCALFEADGCMWKLEAIKRIKNWFAMQLEGIKIIA